MSTQLQALKAFVDTEQNPDLLRLEALLKRFNLFEAVGVVRHELRHSDFLAFLLDPNQTHGLGAAFLNAFLKAVYQSSASSALSSDFDDSSQAYVQREWHHVDILVIDDANRFGIVIENKIGSSEHSDQLNRYRTAFNSHFPGYKVLALYLTPDGDKPSSADYQAVSYTLVCGVIETIVRDIRDMLGGEIVIVLEHYAQMLRRHILSDSDVAVLSRRIYRQHKQALDLIFEHRPDQQARNRECIETLIQAQSSHLSFDPEYSFKNWTIFSLHEWQTSPRHGGTRGENICWILFFQFSNKADNLSLDLVIAPGDEQERDKCIQMAQKHHFQGVRPKLRGKYAVVSSVKFLGANDFEKSQAEIETLIANKWVEYLNVELPRIVEAVRNEKWLWELP